MSTTKLAGQEHADCGHETELEVQHRLGVYTRGFLMILTMLAGAVVSLTFATFLIGCFPGFQHRLVLLMLCALLVLWCVYLESKYSP